MAITISHATQSAVPDEGVAGEIGPSEWNEDHSVSGTLDAAQMPALTGDVTTPGASLATTLATVNGNVGTFGSATAVGQVTVNAKGLVTAASDVTITPAASSITGGAALTRVSDTNVTLTFGGAPTTALLTATSVTVGWSGTLAASRGGFGADVSGSSGIPIFTTGTAAFFAPGTGVQTFLTTPSSANLASALTDKTGTGVNVFATEPTFTTSITDPLVIGGTGTGSTLSLRSTSGVGATDAILFQVGDNGATEAARFTTGGNFVVGGTAPAVTQAGGVNVTPTSQVLAASSSASFMMGRYSADANPGAIYFAKSRNATIGSQTVLQNGDRIGRFSFAGSDGTDMAEAARIEARIDGTPGTGDMPGRIEFSTTADGAEAPTLALTIDSTQQLKFEAASFAANGTGTVTISNVAPAGVATATVTKWLTFKDASGVDSYVPVWQ